MNTKLMGYIVKISIQRYNTLSHSPEQFTVHLYAGPDSIFLASVHPQQHFTLWPSGQLDVNTDLADTSGLWKVVVGIRWIWKILPHKGHI